MEQEYIIIIGAFIFAILLSFITIVIMRRHDQKEITTSINNLDIRRNILSTKPVLAELSKLEEIAKSEQLEEKINEFKVRYEEIKTVKITKIDNMIVELEVAIEKRNKKEYYDKYSDIEIELYETEYSIDKILSDIEEVSSYEEKYRDIITKLKAKYRFLEKSFNDKESLFKDLADVIRMQFENVEKRFNDFELVMDEKLYNEVLLVVKAIDTMIDHLDVVIRELPDILLLQRDLIPARVNDLKDEYKEMMEQEYPLGYLNFDSTIDNVEKKCKDILDRAKVLNIDDSLFDLRIILEYLDNLFKDFDKERNAKKEFEDNNKTFSDRIKKNEQIIKDVYDQMDDIKALYDLHEKDLEVVDNVNLKLASLIKEYKGLLKEVKKCTTSYLKINILLYDLMTRLIGIEDEFDRALKSLGSMYEDEMYAREQLVEINKLIVKCKEKVRKAKLPIIYDNYYVELSDVNEAIELVKNELDNKPIVIKSLNMRVETAKDLMFKLNDTTNKMVNFAYFTELLTTYANRYRSGKETERVLSQVEMLYYAGEYTESYHLVLKLLETKEPGIAKKIKEYQVE